MSEWGMGQGPWWLWVGGALPSLFEAALLTFSHVASLCMWGWGALALGQRQLQLADCNERRGA
jgi:hypothetical protein